MNKTLSSACRAALLTAAAASLSACGVEVYQPSRVAGFELEPTQEIDDDDIAKAFAAQPQMPGRAKVAYYVFDDVYADQVKAMMKALPGVTTSYRIPSLMVTGERHFDTPDPYYRNNDRSPLSIKTLRLLAARAHADLLLIVDYGHKVEYVPNGLVAFSIAIVPLLFLPWGDYNVESYVDSYVIDTRNGYLYGHLHTDEKQEDDYHTIYSDTDDELIDSQLALLLERTGKLLTGLLADEREKSIAIAAPDPKVPNPKATDESKAKAP